MSILKSTNIGIRAIPIKEELLGSHWSKEIFLSEIVYTYKHKPGHSFKQYILGCEPSGNFVFDPLRGKKSIEIKNMYQLKLIEKYFDCEDIKQSIKILEEICQS